MKVKVRVIAGEDIEASSTRVTILLDGKKYTLSENNFGQLVINKIDDEDSAIKILPSTSNEIRIE